MPRALSAAFAAASLLVAVLGVLTQLRQVPLILAGQHFGVLAGEVPNPDFLTGWLPHAIGRECALSSPCVIRVNAAAFALFILGAAVAVRISLARRGFRPSDSAALLVAAALAFSPFAAVLVVDPLGIQLTVTIVLFGIAAADAAALTSLALPARLALIAALVLQDVLLAPVALAYALLSMSSYRPPVRMLLPVCFMLAAAARLVIGTAMHAGPLHLAIDAIAGPIAIVATGVGLFVVLPALLYAERVRYYERVGLSAFAVARMCALALCVLPAGVFASSGDASVYLLCAELAVVACFLPSGRVAGALPALSALAVIAALQVVTLGLFHQDVPAVRIARENASIQALIAFDNARARVTCIVADNAAATHLFASRLGPQSRGRTGARVFRAATLAECPQQYADRTHLVVASGLQTEDWTTGLNLARSAQTASKSPYVFPFRAGTVSPKLRAHTPTGMGAFSQMLPTAAGPIGTFTVLSGFAYTFDCVNVSKGERLTFAVTQIPRAPGATYAVSLRTGSQSYVLTKAFLPHYAGPDYLWRYVSATAPATATCAAVVFTIPSPIRYASVWVTFAGASLH